MPRYSEPSQKQLDFVQWYTSPASPTYDNVVQSAIRAGFSEKYAKSTAHKTLKPIAKKMVTDRRAEKANETVDKADFYNELLHDAEKGIAERVRMNADNDSKLMALQQKDQHLVAETIGKDTWSKRSEQVHAHRHVIDDTKRNTLQATLTSMIAGETVDNPTYTVLNEAENSADQHSTEAQSDDTE